MILKNFYLGLRQVQKVILNGRVIWTNGSPISLMATVMNNSYAKGVLNYIVMFPMAVEAESTSEGSGYLRTIPVFNLYGNGEASSDGLGFLRQIPVSNLYGSAASISFVQGTGFAITVVPMESIVYTRCETFGNARAIPYIRVAGTAEKLYNGTSGSAVAVIILPIESSARSVFRSRQATLWVLNTLSMEGAAQILSHGEALLRDLGVIQLNGRGESSGWASATMDTNPALSLIGASTSESDIAGTIITQTAQIMIGKNASSSNSQAELKLWYLPLQENDTLYVRQAYSAIVNNDILEVI